MLRKGTERTVWRSRSYPLSHTNSFCLQEESRSNLLASVCLQCFTKIISQFRLLSVSSEYSSGHHSIHTRYQEMVENLTLTSPLEASPDVVQAKLPSHTYTAVAHTPPGRHTNSCAFIYWHSTCVPGSRIRRYSALTCTSACSLLFPSFVYVPAVRPTTLQRPPTLTSLKLENSTLH